MTTYLTMVLPSVAYLLVYGVVAVPRMFRLTVAHAVVYLSVQTLTVLMVMLMLLMVS